MTTPTTLSDSSLTTTHSLSPDSWWLPPPHSVTHPRPQLTVCLLRVTTPNHTQWLIPDHNLQSFSWEWLPPPLSVTHPWPQLTVFLLRVTTPNTLSDSSQTTTHSLSPENDYPHHTQWLIPDHNSQSVSWEWLPPPHSVTHSWPQLTVCLLRVTTPTTLSDSSLTTTHSLSPESDYPHHTQWLIPDHNTQSVSWEWLPPPHSLTHPWPQLTVCLLRVTTPTTLSDSSLTTTHSLSPESDYPHHIQWLIPDHNSQSVSWEWLPPPLSVTHPWQQLTVCLLRVTTPTTLSDSSLTTTHPLSPESDYPHHTQWLIPDHNSQSFSWEWLPPPLSVTHPWLQLTVCLLTPGDYPQHTQWLIPDHNSQSVSWEWLPPPHSVTHPWPQLTVCLLRVTTPTTLSDSSLTTTHSLSPESDYPHHTQWLIPDHNSPPVSWEWLPPPLSVTHPWLQLTVCLLTPGDYPHHTQWLIPDHNSQSVSWEWLPPPHSVTHPWPQLTVCLLRVTTPTTLSDSSLTTTHSLSPESDYPHHTQWLIPDHNSPSVSWEWLPPPHSVTHPWPQLTVCLLRVTTPTTLIDSSLTTTHSLSPESDYPHHTQWLIPWPQLTFCLLRVTTSTTLSDSSLTTTHSLSPGEWLPPPHSVTHPWPTTHSLSPESDYPHHTQWLIPDHNSQSVSWEWLPPPHSVTHPWPQHTVCLLRVTTPTTLSDSSLTTTHSLSPESDYPHHTQWFIPDHNSQSISWEWLPQPHSVTHPWPQLTVCLLRVTTPTTLSDSSLTTTHSLSSESDYPHNTQWLIPDHNSQSVSWEWLPPPHSVTHPWPQLTVCLLRVTTPHHTQWLIPDHNSQSVSWEWLPPPHSVTHPWPQLTVCLLRVTTPTTLSDSSLTTTHSLSPQSDYPHHTEWLIPDHNSQSVIWEWLPPSHSVTHPWPQLTVFLLRVTTPTTLSDSSLTTTHSLSPESDYPHHTQWLIPDHNSQSVSWEWLPPPHSVTHPWPQLTVCLLRVTTPTTLSDSSLTTTHSLSPDSDFPHHTQWLIPDHNSQSFSWEWLPPPHWVTHPWPQLTVCLLIVTSPTTLSDSSLTTTHSLSLESDYPHHTQWLIPDHNPQSFSWEWLPPPHSVTHPWPQLTVCLLRVTTPTTLSDSSLTTTHPLSPESDYPPPHSVTHPWPQLTVCLLIVTTPTTLSDSSLTTTHSVSWEWLPPPHSVTHPWPQLTVCLLRVTTPTTLSDSSLTTTHPLSPESDYPHHTQWLIPDHNSPPVSWEWLPPPHSVTHPWPQLTICLLRVTTPTTLSDSSLTTTHSLSPESDYPHHTQWLIPDHNSQSVSWEWLPPPHSVTHPWPQLTVCLLRVTTPTTLSDSSLTTTHSLSPESDYPHHTQWLIPDHNSQSVSWEWLPPPHSVTHPWPQLTICLLRVTTPTTLSDSSLTTTHSLSPDSDYPHHTEWLIPDHNSPSVSWEWLPPPQSVTHPWPQLTICLLRVTTPTTLSDSSLTTTHSLSPESDYPHHTQWLIPDHNSQSISWEWLPPPHSVTHPWPQLTVCLLIVTTPITLSDSSLNTTHHLSPESDYPHHTQWLIPDHNSQSVSWEWLPPSHSVTHPWPQLTVCLLRVTTPTTLSDSSLTTTHLLSPDSDYPHHTQWLIPAHNSQSVSWEWLPPTTLSDSSLTTTHSLSSESDYPHNTQWLIPDHNSQSCLLRVTTPITLSDSSLTTTHSLSPESDYPHHTQWLIPDHNSQSVSLRVTTPTTLSDSSLTTTHSLSPDSDYPHHTQWLIPDHNSQSVSLEWLPPPHSVTHPWPQLTVSLLRVTTPTTLSDSSLTTTHSLSPESDYPHQHSVTHPWPQLTVCLQRVTTPTTLSDSSLTSNSQSVSW